MDETPKTCIRVLQYNVLLDELSTNFIPRTMREPSTEDLQAAFGTGPDQKQRWEEVHRRLDEEYKKWHPLKEVVKNAAGQEVRVRSLWSESNLEALSSKGWDMNGLEVRSAYELGAEGGPVTLLGVLRQVLGEELSNKFYESILEVHETSCTWSVRGPRLLQRICEMAASIVVLEEYDMHALATAEWPDFSAAMDAHGYDGACFRGPGQVAAGVGIFWRRADMSLPEGARLPDNRVVLCGEDLGFVANVDLEEPGVTRASDRRLVGMVRLVSRSGTPVLLCGAHLMTSSRDKTGAVRAFELGRIRNIVGARASPLDAVILCGDFNIDMRSRKGEAIFLGSLETDGKDPEVFETGYSRPEGDAPWLRWRRNDDSELILRDAYGDIDDLEACSSTMTGTRRETIDYIFYDESKMEMLPETRTALKCPEEPMPNSTEPSDHIPLAVTFHLRPERLGPSTTTAKRLLETMETRDSDSYGYLMPCCCRRRSLR